jgi:hypothetical protein
VMSVLYVIYVRYVAMSVAADHSTPERKQSSEDFAFSRVISGFATVRSRVDARSDTDFYY